MSGAIYRWDAASGRQLTPAAAQDSAVEQILVSADGRSLFTTDQDGDLYLWDTAGEKSPRRIAGGIERGVVASSDRRFLAWTVQDVHGNSRIRLYDVAAAGHRPGPAQQRGVFCIGAHDRGGVPAGRQNAPDARARARDRPALGRRIREGAAFVRGNPAEVGWDTCTTPHRQRVLTCPSASGTWRPVRPGIELNEPMNMPAVPDEAGSGTMDYLGLGPLPFCTTRRAAFAPDGKTLAIGRDWAVTLR